MADVNAQLQDLLASLSNLTDKFNAAATSIDVESTKFVNAITKTSDAFKEVVGGKVLSPLVSASKSIADAFKNATNNLNQIGTGGGVGGGPPANETEEEKEKRLKREEEEKQKKQQEEEYFQRSNQIRILNAASQVFSTFSENFNKLIPSLDLFKMAIAGIAQAANALASLPQQIDSLKQNLLGMGTSLENFDAQFSTQIDSLIGDKFQNLQNAATLFSQGFRGNNKGLLSVAAKMDLTGQKTSLLINEFTKLSVLMQLNNAQMNALALNLDKTSQTFGVKTEQLIQVLGKLKNLEVMSTLGFGGEFANNVKELSAKYKMGEDQMIKLVNALTDPRAFQGLAKADPAIIGLVQQLEQATNPKQFEEVFKEIVLRLDSFSQFIAQQAKSGGLPATVLAKQLYGMLSDDLVTASQVAKVFTHRLTESEKQLMKEADVTKSLNASIQKLKTELAPVITFIVDLSTQIVKLNGLWPIMIAAVIKLASGLAQQLLQYEVLRLSLFHTKASLEALAAAATAAAGSQGGAAAAQTATLGLASMGALRMLTPLLKFIPYIGVIATVLSFIPLVLSMFGSEDQDSNNLQTIADNTERMVDLQADVIKSVPQEDTMYSVMARDMAYIISQRDDANRQIIDAITNGGANKQAMDTLVRIGLEQLEAMRSGKAWRGN